MASYDIAQYLLDRANIHDTLVRVALYYDTQNLDGLLSEVYADSIDIDYTSILGGTPHTVSRADWVERIGQLLPQFVSTQHVTSGIVTDLPQPGPHAVRPETVAVQAQAAGHMIGKGESESGGAGKTAPLTQNGGLLEAGLQRDPELEKQGLNPWRITKYKVIKKWDRGDESVLKSAQQ